MTLGAIRRKADAARAYTMFFIPGINHGYDIPNGWDPMRGAEHQNGVSQATCSDRNVMTNAITMWATGNEPAKIASETPRFDETGSDKSTVNAEIKKQVWMMIDVPLVLKSDLLLTHEGVVASQIGSLSILETNGRVVPYAAIELGGPISTPSGEFHDLIVSNPVYRGSALRSEGTKYIHNAVMLQGENTFKGNVRVKEGVLRLSGEAGFRGTIRQLGDKDNKVYVSAEGALDLMGGKTPASHHLYLGGKSASTTFGNLYSSDLDPLALAEWCGPVTLTGDAAIGGYPSSTQLSDNSGATKNVLNSDGNLRVSGAIDGAFDISVRGARQIEFAGDNSAFTGNMVLEGTGARTRFVNDAALPSNGRLVLNGGVIRVGAETDGDVSKLGAKLDTTTNNKRLLLDVEAGVTYNPAQGFAKLNQGFGKAGKGKLVIDKNNVYTTTPTFFFDEGDTVFDFTSGATSLWGESMTGDDKGTFRLANDAHLTIKVPEDYVNHGFNTLKVLAGMFPRFTLESESDFKVQNFTVDADGFLMVDPLTGAGNVLTKTTPNGGPLGNGNVFYGETTFACRGNPNEMYGTLQGFPDEDYATTFDGVSVGAGDSSESAVDVTAELVAGGPVSFTNRILRFNTPAAGKEIVVNMTGFTNVVSGTILLTPNLGDTHVIFRGGALTAPADGSVRIVNLNTNANAYVEIDCDVVSGGWALANNRASPTAPKVNLVIAGRGRTVFRGDNRTNLNNYFIDCNIEMPTSGLLRNHTVDDGDNRDMCKVNGANFIAAEDINLAGNGYLGSKKGSAIRFEPTVGRMGMGLGALANKTLTISRYADCYFTDGSSINKVGAGTVQINASLFYYNLGFGTAFDDKVFPTELVMRSRVTGGKLSNATRATACNDFFGHRPIRIDVSDGVTFAGPSFLHAAGETSAAIPLCDFGRRQSFVVPKNATATFDRSTGTALIYHYNWYGSGMPAMYAKASGHFAGDGTIVLTDSVDATAGIRPTGESHPNFRGTLRAEVPYIAPGDGWTGSLGVMYPNATFEIPTGKMQSFAQAYKDYFAVRLGALSGSGTYSVNSVADSRACSWTYVGCDDASRAAEFTGTLSGVYASPLVKIGKSTQKFSGAGALKGTVRVRDGTLVIGHTNAFSYVDGARYYDYVLLGDGKTTAGMEPQFLAEGVDEVKNPVRVIGCADASVTPVIGVASGTTTFAKLTVSNNVKVVANAAGSKATIARLTLLDACDVSVGGAGEVEFAGDVTLPAGVGASFGTTFTVGGKLTVGEGAAFALSGLPDALDPTQAYILVSAAGGIEGTFDFSGVTLPKGWVLQQKADKVVLKFQNGLILIVR